MSTVIKEPQQMFLNIVKKILKLERGYDVSDLHFYSKPPVSLLGAINPTDYISIEEGRKIFHLPELSEEQLEKLKEEKSSAKQEVSREGVSTESTDKKEEDGVNN
jgi:hypothetical protein